jgi:hypothetical protein
MGDIVHAYALVQSKAVPGKFYAVHLENVLAERFEILEPSARAEPAAHGVSRILHALDIRQFKKAWGRV